MVGLIERVVGPQGHGGPFHVQSRCSSDFWKDVRGLMLEGECPELNVCISLKFTRGGPNLCGGMEVAEDWTSVLPRRDTRELLLSAPLHGHQGPSEKAALCKRGSGFSPGAERVGTSSLDFPASKTVINKFRLLKPLWYLS